MNPVIGEKKVSPVKKRFTMVRYTLTRRGLSSSYHGATIAPLIEIGIMLENTLILCELSVQIQHDLKLQQHNILLTERIYV